MAEHELNTTLMTNMELQECLGRKGRASVYTVKSTKTEQLYVLKHISIPENQKQVDALILTGAAADEAAALFRELAETECQNASRLLNHIHERD